MSQSPEEEYVSFLNDLYSVELQALTQLKDAPDIAGGGSFAAHLREHYAETERQAQLMRARLESQGGSPSSIKDAVMKLGGKAFVLFANLQPETPGRLLAHAYSYEAMEWAGYSVLIRMAEELSDMKTAEVARAIQTEERIMMERLEDDFDAVEEASHRQTAQSELPAQVIKHLAEAHALEQQSIKLLEKAAAQAQRPDLRRCYEEYLHDAREQAVALRDRLEDLDSSPSTIKDAAMKLGGLNWATFFRSQKDTPAKLLIFVYAVGHLKIAGYELLQRVARRADDYQTGTLAAYFTSRERTIARDLLNNLDQAADATFEAA